MSKKLAVTVFVHNEDSEVVRYLAGETPSAADAKLILNPDVWEEDEPDEDGPPPKAGAGSGVEAWREYAESRGISVPDDATRNDIIAAVEAE